VKQAPFEAAHAAEWQEFEKFLDHDKSSKLDPADMPRLYRRICQSLALATDRQYSPTLVDRLNLLALRGHHALYENRRRESQRVLEFLLAGFPALVRREWRPVLVAPLLFFGPLTGLIALLQVYPEFVHYLLRPEQIAGFHEMYDPASRRLGMREADTSLMMFGFYIWNNTGIGFQTFAGGIFAGVGSIWFLASNGVILGAVSGYLTEIGYTRTFWSFVAGHSSWELLAIALSGAAGLRLLPVGGEQVALDPYPAGVLQFQQILDLPHRRGGRRLGWTTWLGVRRAGRDRSDLCLNAEAFEGRSQPS
jgi:uncharacterized membrane protein SpoIIM required for sporulation